MSHLLRGFPVYLSRITFRGLLSEKVFVTSSSSYVEVSRHSSSHSRGRGGGDRRRGNEHNKGNNINHRFSGNRHYYIPTTSFSTQIVDYLIIKHKLNFDRIYFLKFIFLAQSPE